MTERRLVNRIFVASDERDLIRYQLEMLSRPEVVKAGLQRLCSLYESGKRLAEPEAFQTLVSGLVWQPSPLVRRWAYKALAYVGDHSTIPLLRDRLNSEPDRENLTWIVSAIFGLLKGWTLANLRAEFGVQADEAMTLAALLFSCPDDAIGDLPKIDIETGDPLTLKWCSLLAGYGKAPPNLFHPRIENAQLLTALNAHDVSEVSEYSVWAMWKAGGFSMQDLAMPLDTIGNRPDNVKRWINRLLVKEGEFLSRHLDLFEDMGRDRDRKAREGLALGIRDQHVDGLDERVLGWFGRERDTEIQELLLEHMATATFHQPDYYELLVDRYGHAGLESGLRRRLRASVHQRDIFQRFQKMDFAAKVAMGPDMFGGPPFGSFVMNQNTINVSGDINAQNVAGGDLTAIANESIQQINNESPEIAQVLREILSFAQSGALEPQQAAQLMNAINDVAKEPTPAKKGILLGTLQSLASTISIASAASKLPELIQNVSDWL